VDPRAVFWVGTTRRGELYRCPGCGKTGTKEEVATEKFGQETQVKGRGS